MNRTAEQREAERLARAIDAHLAGRGLPTDRPADLDPLIALLAAHRSTVRAAASLLPVSHPRTAPARGLRAPLIGAMVVAALIVCVWSYTAASRNHTPSRTPLALTPIALTVAGIADGPLPTPAGAQSATGAQGFVPGDCPSVSAPGVLGLDGRPIIQSSAYFYFHVRETADGSIEMWADTAPTSPAPTKAMRQIPPGLLALYVDDLLSACQQSRRATLAAGGSLIPSAVPIVTIPLPARYRVVNTSGADLNVREDPVPRGRILATLTAGAEVQVTGVGTAPDDGANWYRVQVGETTGYVRQEFLQPVTPTP